MQKIFKTSVLARVKIINEQLILNNEYILSVSIVKKHSNLKECKTILIEKYKEIEIIVKVKQKKNKSDFYILIHSFI